MWKGLSRQRGHVAVQWALTTLMVVLAMFAPLPGTDQSLVALVMDSIRQFYMNLSLIMSLP